MNRLQQAIENELISVVDMLHKAGLTIEANKLNEEVLKALADGKIDSTEAQELAKAVTDSADALRADGKNKEAAYVDEVAKRCLALVVQLLRAEEAASNQVRERNLMEALELGKVVAAGLENDGLHDEAAAMARINMLLQKAVAGMLTLKEIDQAIADAEALKTKLTLLKRDQDVAALMTMITQMQAARTAQLAAGHSGEKKLLLGADQTLQTIEVAAGQQLLLMEVSLNEAGLKAEAAEMQHLRELMAKGDLTGRTLTLTTCFTIN